MQMLNVSVLNQDRQGISQYLLQTIMARRYSPTETAEANFERLKEEFPHETPIACDHRFFLNEISYLCQECSVYTPLTAISHMINSALYIVSIHLLIFI